MKVQIPLISSRSSPPVTEEEKKTPDSEVTCSSEQASW